MNAELSHREAKGLFFAHADQALDAASEQKLTQHLDACNDCRIGWDRYHRAVESVRNVEREKAPPMLASVLARRARRRRPFGIKGMQFLHAHHRLPAEMMLPLLVAAALAALLLMLAQ
ncbi:MAG: zf-HC2 domain-containing protein [Myxococcaceae bacterium]